MIILLPLIPVSGALSPKAGASCTKKGSVQIFQGKKFTCVQSGKKLIWDKGTIIKQSATTPTNNSGSNTASSPVSSTGQSSTSPTDLPTQHTECNVLGKKYLTSYGFIRCDWLGQYSYKWIEHHIPVLQTSKLNNYKVTPIAGQTCNQSGDTFDVAGGYLECRYISGGKLLWMKINTIKNTFNNTLSPSGVNICRLQNSDVDVSKLPENTRGGVKDTGQVAGFPTQSRNAFNNPGLNRALVVGVDFPELRGIDADLKSVNAYDKKMLNEWYSYFSNGQVKYELTTIDYWLHAPKSAKSYSTSGTFDSTAQNGNAGNDVVTQEMIDIITKEIDLTPFATIFLIFPKGEITLDTDWIVRNRPFKTKEGIRNLNFFGWGKDNESMATLHWAYYIHEVLHDGTLIGHAPGNGWPFGIMAQQSGISESPFAWEQFQLGWLPDDQIYCIDKSDISKSVVSLTPMEREDKQSKMAVIKLSKTKAIVVESHGIDKWSSFNTNDRSYPGGFYGVMSYLIDLEKTVAPPVETDGRAIQADSGNDPKYPRWAYWQKIDNGPSFLATFDYKSGTESWNPYFAVLGDTFTIEGVKIKLIGTGDYETIEITKV